MHEVVVECKVCTERRKPAALELHNGRMLMMKGRYRAGPDPTLTSHRYLSRGGSRGLSF